MQPESSTDDTDQYERAGPYFVPSGAVPYWEDWPFAEPDDAATGAARSPGSRGRHAIREVVETGVLALLVFLCIRAALGTYSVEGHSMDPTLQDGEFLFVSKLHYLKVDLGKLGSIIPFIGSDGYLLAVPSRGDIVVLKNPREPVQQDLVKRIIGLPGETVEIAGGRVYIDGRLLDEPYIAGAWTGSSPKVFVPDGEYYVLGDNRGNSSDSRSFGPVAEEMIEGEVVASPWPPSKFGAMVGARPTLANDVTRP